MPGKIASHKPRDGKRSTYRELDRIGRIRLSHSFFFRDFLHSEIAAVYNIVNMPDDLELAIETGSRLCEDILEPLQAHFGSIRIRSGYRSSALNAFGHKHHLNCASNEKNNATHIWDRLDAHGNKGASACVVIPSLMHEDLKRSDVIHTITEWSDAQPHVDHIRFFKQVATFNIGWRSCAPSSR
ncbi:MAG: hypothetical protein RLN89_06875 [Parvibaculum sp.]